MRLHWRSISVVLAVPLICGLALWIAALDPSANSGTATSQLLTTRSVSNASLDVASSDIPVLFLAGVFSYDDKKRGMALLGTSSENVVLYRVGERLPGGARLHTVLEDRVLLERGGRMETLLLSSRWETAEIVSSRSAVVPPGLLVQHEAPGELGQVMQYSELRSNGRLRAVQIMGGADAEHFWRLGFRSGDLVIAIDGVPIEQQPSGERALNTLVESGVARVTVVRDGTKHNLEFSLAGKASLP